MWSCGVFYLWSCGVVFIVYHAPRARAHDTTSYLGQIVQTPLSNKRDTNHITTPTPPRAPDCRTVLLTPITYRKKLPTTYAWGFYNFGFPPKVLSW